MYKHESGALRFVWYFICKQKIGYFLFLLVCISGSLSTSLWPYITGKIVDALTSYQGDKSNFFYEFKNLFYITIGFWFSVETMLRIQGFTYSFIIPKLEANMRMYSFGRLLSFSHYYFNKNKVGDIANKIRDIPTASSMIIDVIFINFIPILGSTLISTYIFFSINYVLGALLILWLVIHMGLNLYYCNKSAQRSQVQSRARSILQGSIVESFRNILSVIIFNNFIKEIKINADLQEDERKKHVSFHCYVEFARVVFSVLGFLALIFLFSYAVLLWQKDEISIGQIVIVLATILNLWDLIKIGVDEITYLFRDLGILRQGLEIFQQEHQEVLEYPNAKDLVVSKGEIEFRDVSFQYLYNKNDMRYQSIKIKGGEKIGLVGFSGSGKTTFAKLITRLFDVKSGEILIDGQDISKVTLKSLRENIGFITQEPQLFHRSVYENIAYGLPIEQESIGRESANAALSDSEGLGADQKNEFIRMHLEDQALEASALDNELGLEPGSGVKSDAKNSILNKVIEAAKMAHCHEFICSMSDGYYSDVGEQGSNLSGGQKQRLAIARAMLKNSSIIIMDEATSSQDVVTEKHIQESINNLMQGRTSIIIAHRLSTLKDVDKIFVFDGGSIVEYGTHDELISKNGHYKKMWRLQHDGFLPETDGSDEVEERDESIKLNAEDHL